MDTGTHFLIGITLGGLSVIDPVVASNSQTASAVFVATIVGSQIPDIDTILKTKGNAIYIKNHRGLTHSIYGLFGWPTAIALLTIPFYGSTDWNRVWGWTFLAVLIHIITDIFNGYGTQFLQPFSDKWVAIGAINTFDPLLFVLHLSGIILWLLGFPRLETFVLVYVLMVIYYLRRVYMRTWLESYIRSIFKIDGEVIISSTLKSGLWKVVFSTKENHYVAKYSKPHLEIEDFIERKPSFFNRYKEKIIQDKNIQAFLSFSPIYHYETTEKKDFTEVRFMDLRYRNRARYTFVAVVHVNKDGDILSSYTGWIFSESKLQRKLQLQNE